jgi:hypothetical protein
MWTEQIRMYLEKPQMALNIKFKIWMDLEHKGENLKGLLPIKVTK